MTAPRRFVITGPPGGGKTPLIGELVARGYLGAEEPARAVIAAQRVVDPRPIYDRDPRLFLELMLAHAAESFEHATTAGAATFFDRGVPDLIGYAELFGVDTSDARAAADRCRYDDPIFVLPSWREIYVTDEDRRMTFEDAEAFGDRVRAIYLDLGYALVDVPRDTIASRADLVVATVVSREGSGRGTSR